MAAASAPWAVTVALASGRAVELQLGENEQGTSAVRALASRAFGFRVTALVTQDGRRLPEGAALLDLGLGDGAALTAVVEQVVVHSGRQVFLALAGARFLASWGHADSGGDSSSVRAELEGALVQKVSFSRHAVAVLTTDGRVVTWGHVRWGGDSGKVRAELQEGVRDVCASSGAFAAVKEDGRLVVWGALPRQGRPVGLPQDIRCLSGTDSAFAGVRLGGTVVAWGHGEHADISSAEPYLRDVRQLVSGDRAFAALTGSGGMVAWQGPGAVWREEHVRQVCITEAAMAVLQGDGAVKVWGLPLRPPRWDDDDEAAWAAPAEARSGVQRICAAASGRAFAALTRTGGVVFWGSEPRFWRGDARVDSGAEGIYATWDAFAALLSGGKVVAWGEPVGGGDCSGVQEELESGVVHVSSTQGAFAAVKATGEVVTWGGAECGGDSSDVAALFRPLGRDVGVVEGQHGPRTRCTRPRLNE